MLFRSGIACGREGGKGELKSAAVGGLKRKSPPPFPLALGYGNDGKPYGFTTFPHPAAHPLFPSDFLLRKYSPALLKRGAFIINEVNPHFCVLSIPHFLCFFKWYEDGIRLYSCSNLCCNLSHNMIQYFQRRDVVCFLSGTTTRRRKT